jgi:hypothetical protein
VTQAPDAREAPLTERDEAVAEADAANEATSAELNRPRIIVQETGQDITESIVSILDALDDALNSGSGWLDEEEERATDTLKKLLLFRCGDRKYQMSGRWLNVRSELVGECDLPFGHGGEHRYQPVDPVD